MSRLTTSSGERAVRSGKDGAVRRRSFATFAARSVGTLVKSDTTSKDTRVISGRRVRPAIKVENSAESFTSNADLPTSGTGLIVRRCFESAYVGGVDEGDNRLKWGKEEGQPVSMVV